MAKSRHSKTGKVVPATHSRGGARLDGDQSTSPASRFIPTSDFRPLYDLAPVTWLVLDTSGTILDINPSGCRVFEAEYDFIVGTPLRMWVNADFRAVLSDHVRRCRNGSDAIETELRLKGRGGHMPFVRLHSRKTLFQQSIVFPTVAIDITEQEQLSRARSAAERERDIAEEERRVAKAAEAAKDRLIAMVSHELRNPLSPALMAATTLTMWPGLPKTAHDMAATIKRNIELEARLIDDLLDMARVTHGQLELKKQPIDVHRVIEHASEACSQAALSKGVRIVLNCQADHHIVEGDHARLQQVFWNLLNNAIKFSHRDGHVFVRTLSNEDGVLLVTVRDFGLGMDLATVSKLFSPFAQPRAPDSGHPGLGLGLTITRNIVELHGGQIWASSDGAGTGSTFEVELVTSSGELHGGHDALEAAAVPSGVVGRLLLVEDHEDTADLLSECLTQQGYDVTRVRTLEDGLHQLEEEWDIVVSDIGLGTGSGLDIAKCASQKPRKPHLIALSGFGSSKDIEASLAAGFEQHLVKPVDLRMLLQALKMS